MAGPRHDSIPARPAVVLGLFCVALCYLVLTLDSQGLWLDEISSAYMSSPHRSLRALWTEHLHDKHPPLYFLLLHYWQRVAGTSDAAVRALSLLPFVATGVLLAVGYQRRLLRTGTGYLPLLFLTSSGVLFHAAQARPYMFALTATLAILLLSFHALDAIEQERRLSPWFWVALALTTITGSLIHYFVLLYATIALAALGVLLARSRRHREIVGVAVIAGIALGADLYWLLVTHDTWAAAPPLRRGWDVLFIARRFGALAISYNVVLALLALWATTRWYRGLREDPKSVLAFTTVVLTLAAAVLISFVEPIIRPRNLIVLLPGTFYVMSVALSHWASSRSRRAALAGCFSLSLVLAIYLHRMPVEQWRESARYVDTVEGCDVGTVLAYPDWRPFIYHTRYLERAKLQFRRAREGVTPQMRSQSCPLVLWAGHLSEYEFAELQRQLGLDDGEAFDVKSFERVFLVLRAPGGS